MSDEPTRKSKPMPAEHSTYPLEELLTRWKRGDLTVEQLAGYMLQHLIHHDQRLTQVEKTRGRIQTPSDKTHPAS